MTDRKPRRGPKRATPERLERSALAYLERFATSRENLRRVLMRRVSASATVHGTDPEAGAEAVEAILAKLERYGYLDDAAFAEMRSESLHRRGLSRRAIRYKLSEKGVAEAEIDRAVRKLEAEAEREGEDPDLLAAMNYARRRRIGPFRQVAKEGDFKRDLAALARQGFSYDIARQVLDVPEDFEDGSG